MSNFQFKGIDNVLKNLDKAEKVVVNAIEQGVMDLTNKLLTESEKQVPMDIGTLAGSGHTTPVENRGGMIEGKVGYNTPYAARLHEHPEYKFQKGRKGKYLIDPLKDLASVGKKYLEGLLRGALNG